MTQKDYKIIARAINNTRARHSAFTQHFGGVTFSAFDSLVDEMSSALKADNPYFDRERFVTACETGKGC